MNYLFPDIKKALVLSPHPDDEALGCSGTIMLLSRRGVSIDLIFLTNGERLYGEPSEEIGRLRVEEAKGASMMLGCRETIFLGFPDGELIPHSNEIYQSLKKIIEDKRHDLVFSPSPIDYHHDHIATAKASMRLFEDLNYFKLAFYEIYSTVRFNQLVDITDVAEKKRQVILNYSKSLYNKPELYVYASLGLNAQRSIYTQKRQYYEAFLFIDKPIEEEKIYNYLCYRTDNLYPLG